jgi:hypothetical protein
MLDATTMTAPALVTPEDGLQPLVRAAVRGAIEAALDAERTAALDTTLARLYLSGASTRDLRCAGALPTDDERDRADLHGVSATDEAAGGAADARGDRDGSAGERGIWPRKLHGCRTIEAARCARQRNPARRSNYPNDVLQFPDTTQEVAEGVLPRWCASDAGHRGAWAFQVAGSPGFPCVRYLTMIWRPQKATSLHPDWSTPCRYGACSNCASLLSASSPLPVLRPWRRVRRRPPPMTGGNIGRLVGSPEALRRPRLT